MKETFYTVNINYYGDRLWYLNGKKHNGPAVEYTDGSKFWHLNSRRHRANKPAVECTNGYKAWYFNDKQYDPYNRIFKILSNSNCCRSNSLISKSR